MVWLGLVAAAAASVAQPADSARLERMVALYDELCLDDFETAGPAFAYEQPQEMDVAGYHVAAVSASRPLSGGRTEALLAIEQRVTDPQRRANGETRVSVRRSSTPAPADPRGAALAEGNRCFRTFRQVAT